jgi:DNA-binding NtrC family response regulator
MIPPCQAPVRPMSEGFQPLIGVVEDDPIMGESLVQRLRLEGYGTCWWQSGEAALAYLRKASCHVLVCDIRLPDLSGEQLFRRALPTLGTTPVIFVTAFGEVEQAVRLMQAGANDYITKPFEIDALLDKIALFCAREVAAGSDTPGRQALSGSPAMRRLHHELLGVKDRNDPVLLLGETGVGKEVAARQLHEASLRKDLPFVIINCATLPAERAESMIFGHERGAIPGSRTAQIGLVEQAAAGTLFLDEVSALSPLLQGKFLRLIEDGRYTRLGATQEMISEARIVSSSNIDLPALVREGRFRADLYYRLNVVELAIPPLRARRENIIPLAEHFMAQVSRDAGHRIPTLTPVAVTELLDYSWPGNVRELRHRVQRALDLAGAGAQVSAHMLFPERSLLEESEERVSTLAEARERAERLHIEEAIRQTRGEIAKAAALLGISRTTLWEKMRRLRIQ